MSADGVAKGGTVVAVVVLGIGFAVVGADREVGVPAAGRVDVD